VILRDSLEQFMYQRKHFGLAGAGFLLSKTPSHEHNSAIIRCNDAGNVDFVRRFYTNATDQTHLS